jgi:hypothetical protein
MLYAKNNEVFRLNTVKPVYKGSDSASARHFHN